MAIEDAREGLKHFPEQFYISLNASPSTILCGAHAIAKRMPAAKLIEWKRT